MSSNGEAGQGRNSHHALRGKALLEVLSILGRRGRISRAEIARLADLTPATVSHAVSELARLCITRQLGHGKSQGGRRPILIELNPDAFYLVGVDLGITKVIGVVTDLHGTILGRERIPIDVHAGSEEILEIMITAAHGAIKSSAKPLARLAGVGLSVSGLIDAARGISIFAPNIPGWRDVPIAKVFREEFSLPVITENDARAMALGEARFGAGRGYDNIFCVNIGHGIGSGIVIDGKLYRGRHYTAGEFGHLTVLPSGPTCHCGNRGCLETIAGGNAIAAGAIRVVSSGGGSLIRQRANGQIDKISARVVVEAAQAGDAAARHLLEEAGRYLGIAIASVINLLDPEIVIIGGGVAGAGELLFDEVRKTLKQRAFTTMVATPPLVPSLLGENASAIGAATLVLSEIVTKRGLLPEANPC
ncbi:MAG: ROK family transcriptional regulator [Spirochaetales bacterium]|nr:ROK family transcriptional regulator [Spirochaetales bacterium]